MSRKQKNSKSTAHKGQKAQLARRQNLKEQLLKQRKRQPRFDEFLDEVYDLYEDGLFEDVRDMIQAWLATQPQAVSLDAWEMFGHAAIQLNDSPAIAKAFRHLSERVPNERHYQMNYGGALFQLALPYLSKTAFERLVRNWPSDPLCEGARETLQHLEKAVEEAYAKFPWNDAERKELAVLHEEMLYGLATNDFAHVIKFGTQLLARSPNFPPAFNNLALAYLELGKTDDAIRLCQDLLGRDPGNPHAILILGDSLYAQGKRTAAREAWSRLRTLAPEHQERLDGVTRQMEALARLGEYEALLATLDAVERQDLLGSPDPIKAVIYHLAGVAAARLGQHRTASQHWSRALQINPNYAIAAENRDDHEQPEGVREGPWVENRMAWLPQQLFQRLLGGPATNEGRDQQLVTQMETAVQTLIRLYPELPDLVSDTLQSGAPKNRQLVILLCQGSESLVLHERLRDFALSSHGSDDVRIKLAMWLGQKKVITEKKVNLWSKGQQSEVLLVNSKITFEGRNSFPAEVQELHQQAFETLRAFQFTRAEKLFRQCLAITGDDPSLLFNLASAIEHQERAAEAEAIYDDIIQRWPDYFFGKIHLAKRALQAGDYVAARGILTTLVNLEEYHASEYTMLCCTYVDLEMSCGEPEAAKTWLKQARQIDPDNPNIAMFDQRMSPVKLLRTMLNGLG